jgi:hypothetical protein
MGVSIVWGLQECRLSKAAGGAIELQLPWLVGAMLAFKWKRMICVQSEWWSITCELHWYVSCTVAGCLGGEVLWESLNIAITALWQG